MTCSICGAQIPGGVGRCPNCWSSLPREGWLRRLLRGLGLGTPVVIRTESITRTERIEVQEPRTGKVQLYDSLDKVPADIRAMTVTDASGTTRTYDSVDEMPAEIREIYERALKGKIQ